MEEVNELNEDIKEIVNENFKFAVEDISMDKYLMNEWVIKETINVSMIKYTSVKSKDFERVINRLSELEHVKDADFGIDVKNNSLEIYVSINVFPYKLKFGLKD